MARTKKKRNYKKAPKNTRVFRCVQKVKKKQEIGAAIAICQSSTKQSYRTGRSLKGGPLHKKKTRKMRGGFRVILKENMSARGRKTGEAHATFKAGMSGMVEEVQQIEDRSNPQSSTEYWKVTFDRPGDWVTSGRDEFSGLTKLWPADFFERVSVVQQENNQQGSGKRRRKTRKKRGKGGVFSCPGCGDKKKKKQERDFYTVIDSYGKEQKMYYSDDDGDSSDEDLNPMTDSEQEEEMPLIEQPADYLQPVRRLVRIPSEGSLKLGSKKIKEWHHERSTSPTMDPDTALHHDLPRDHFAEVDKIMEKAAEKGLGGGRRKKKTRKMRGGWTRSSNLDAGNAAFYKCTGSNNSTYREGMIIMGPRVYKDKIDRWEIIRMKDSFFLDPILLLKDIPSGTEFEKQAQQLCNKGYVNEADLLNPYLNFATNVARGGRKKKTRKKRGGEKSKRVKSLIKIFQQYPEIFPSGYFRFLGARLQNHIDKKTLWYKNGVILTWIKYQKTVKKKPKCIIKPGDVKLDQIVNKNQGNGAAKKIVLQFLEKFKKDRIWLEVRANNKRAIRFYKDRGFKRVCKIKFGEIRV